MSQAPLRLRRSKRVEYARLVDMGVFEREALELIGGQLVVAEPQGTSSTVYGWRYRSVVALTRADVVVPRAFPSARISVTDLLPLA